MNIYLKRLQVRNLGPITDLSIDFAPVNLIYGLNESGKTYLVEFLLQSLFKHSRNWDLRDSSCQGAVEIAGLEKEPTMFSPDQRLKIEDYWSEFGSGLPLNMAKLLVVKGGELNLAPDGPGGVNRNVLKTALTSQALLDEIWDAIQQTVRNARLEDGLIMGHNMGKLKDQNILQEEVKHLENLLDKIEGKYSRGPIRKIELALDEIDNKLEEQNKAKQHLAYNYAEELQELTAKKGRFNTDQLTELRDRIRDHARLREDLGSLEIELENLKNKDRKYSWVASAIDTWEEKGLDNSNAPSRAFGLTGLLALASGIALLVLEITTVIKGLFWPGIITSLGGFGFAIYYGIRLLQWSDSLDESREREVIQEDFENKFGWKPNSLTDLKQQKDSLQSFHFSVQSTQKQKDDKVSQLNALSQTIRISFAQITNTKVRQAEWDKTIQQLYSNLERIDAAIIDLQIKLGNLDVMERDYRPQPGDEEFSPDIVQDLINRRDQLNSELNDYLNVLETLKARACEQTGDDLSTPWEDVYYHLRKKYRDTLQQLHLLTAQIVAEIGLTDVLTQLREQEDQKIVQALNTPEVSRLLLKITGKYHQLDLDGDQLIVKDNNSQYALQNLSTGAREQVQLALRLGFASQVVSGNPLFLILDDAFQHSDWKRRAELVQTTLELAAAGWQIIYLSMDDHIRELYLESAQAALKNDFQFLNLS